jgi:hypothetical protein
MTKKNLLSLVTFIVMAFLLFCKPAHAVTITLIPSSPITAGDTVRIDVRGTLVSTNPIQIDYGEGAGWEFLGSAAIGPFDFTVHHQYATPGTYTIRARSVSGVATAPDPVSVPLVVNPVTELDRTIPDAILGLQYEHQIEVSNTRIRDNRFRITRGRLPENLRMDRYGKITGVPEVLGKFPFTVAVVLKDGTKLSRQFTMLVTRTGLTVEVSPNPVQVDRNRSATYTLTYRFSADDPLDDELESGQGTFWAGHRQIGVFNRRITGTLKSGQGKIREKMTVPLSVIKTVQRMGLREILYKRTFTSRYMEAKTVSMATIVIGTGFSISRMHIYFDEDRAKMMVKRNQKDIAASVDITYDGAGLLKGYWQVDSRILARVQKQLPHGRNRVVTFTYPGHPPLPTYFIGSHRLRFVVTEPKPREDEFPFVIYVVSGDSLQERNPVRIVFPDRGKRVSLQTASFRWKPAGQVDVYLLSFYEKDKDTPFFTAYARGGTYQIKEEALEKFMPGQSYTWQIRGYDKDGNVVALSRSAPFQVVPVDHAADNGKIDEKEIRQ